MARAFMDENFLLESETSRALYEAAKNEPVYDYHCHLSPLQIAQNINMDNLADAWLCGDHYKWRMMRAMGIEEKYITGNAESYDKFLFWAKTIENLIGNPLYHWTHLELRRYFDIYEPLTEKSVPAIWEKANALLKTQELSVKGIFEKFKIHTIGTTDDPSDSLEHHKAIADGTAAIGKISTRIIPSFRPDRALDIQAKDFPQYINTLSNASGIKINNLDDLMFALEKRLDYFISLGCRSSDHGLNYVPFVTVPKSHIKKTLKKALACKPVSHEEADSYKTAMLAELGKLYAKKNIVMQLHLNVIRNVNSKALKTLGANTGFDAVNDRSLGENLAALLNLMETPKTILYSLNPKDYYPLATIMGGFQGESIAGKMQMGSAWWFCDHRDGMEEHLRVLGNLGLLPTFVGMLTDSRSFLSYPRHEYFRRVMCNLTGRWVENGEYPKDLSRLEKIVRNISFGNALAYFG